MRQRGRGSHEELKLGRTSMGRVLKTIGIDAIDSGDHTFSMTFHPDLEALTRSIRDVGLIQPLIVREKSRGSGYQLVSGFKRLTACEQLGLKDVEAFSYPKPELGDREGFTMALHENLTTRSLNLVEKSMVTVKLVRRFGLSRESVARDYMPLLGLQPSRRILEKMSQVFQLRPEIKRYMVEEGVSLENALRIVEFSPEDQGEIAGVVSQLRLGENKLKEVLTFLWEVSSRDGVTVRELVRGDIEAITADTALSGVQKTHRVRRRLREMRYPRLTGLEKDFQEKLKMLGLGPRISLQPPPYFEGEAFRLEARFRSVGEFKDIVSGLAEASKRKELGEMIDGVP
jgi:ParB family chromosome partitioning protein